MEIIINADEETIEQLQSIAVSLQQIAHTLDRLLALEVAGSKTPEK